MSKYHKHFVKDNKTNCVDYRYWKRISGFTVFFYSRKGKIVAKSKLLQKEVTANTLHSCLLKVANALKRVKKADLEKHLQLR